MKTFWVLAFLTAPIWAQDAKDFPKLPPISEQTRALLPPPQTVEGVEISITDAGFATPEQLNNRALDAKPAFFAHYQLSPKPQSRSDFARRFQFIGFSYTSQIQFQDGTPLVGNAEGITPTTKMVYATFALLKSEAPPDAYGSFQTSFELSSAELTAQKLSAQPKTVFKTAHGTQLILEKIEWNPQENSRSYHVRLQKLELEFPVQVGLNGAPLNRAYEAYKGQRIEDSIAEDYDVKVFKIYDLIDEPPVDSKLRITVFESASQWRKNEFFQFLTFALPVSELAKARPLTPVAPRFAPITVENEQFKATLEPTEVLMGCWRAQLWLELKDPNAPQSARFDEMFEVNSATLQKDDMVLANYMDDAADYDRRHSDGHFASPNEIKRLLTFNEEQISEAAPATMDLTVQLSQKRQREFPLSMNLKIPPRDELKQFPDATSETSPFALRKAVWASPENCEDLEKRFGVAKGTWKEGALLLVFSTHVQQTGSMGFVNSKFSSAGKAVDLKTYGSFEGDVTALKNQPQMLSLVVQAPVGIENLHLNTRVSQKMTPEQLPPFVFKAVPSKVIPLP